MLRDFHWSGAEKAVAKAAFEKAYKKEIGVIVAEVRKKIDNISDPKDIWRVHDYLSMQRKQTDEKYDYRYSVLLMVFARLIQEKWLTEADLNGLEEEKLKVIRTILAF